MSVASLIVSSVDRYGQKHSKVLLNLEYDFTLDSNSATFISMGVRVSGDHGNNIGLVVGHCDGSISNAKVSKSLEPSLDREALRLVKSMPHWIPGKQNGEPVRVNYTVPVTFRLQ